MTSLLPLSPGAPRDSFPGGIVERVASGLLRALIRAYQLSLAPVFPLVLGPGCGCRFHPTCSHFAAEAIRIHGPVAGVVLSLRRLGRCHPLHPGGLDPVPERQERRPTCRRTAPVFTLSHPNG